LNTLVVQRIAAQDTARAVWHVIDSAVKWAGSEPLISIVTCAIHIPGLDIMILSVGTITRQQAKALKVRWDWITIILISPWTLFIVWGISEIQGVKEALKGCNTDLMCNKVTVNLYPESSACWDMDDVRVISAAYALCGYHVLQHNFQHFVAQRCVFCWKFLVSLEIPERNSLFVAVIPLRHWLAMKAPKPLGVPTAKNPED
jgi:hypothetical protein